MSTTPKKILLGVTASIAAYKACDLIKDLKKAGFDVTVVLTKDAAHFVTPLSLETFSGKKVIVDFFSSQTKPVHIDLAQNSDLILIAPATADVMAKIAHGLADDVLTCTVLASGAPVVIVPAMNDKMLSNPFTQENMARLKKNSIHIIEPVSGALACGYEAAGHIAENSTIIKMVETIFTQAPKKQ